MSIKYTYLIMVMISFIILPIHKKVSAIQLITKEDFKQEYQKDCSTDLSGIINKYITETNSKTKKKLRKCIILKEVFEKHMLDNNAHGINEYKTYTGTVTKVNSNQIHFIEIGADDQKKKFIIDSDAVVPCRKIDITDTKISTVSSLVNRYVCKLHVIFERIYQIDVLYKIIIGELKLVNNYSNIKIVWKPPNTINDTSVRFKLYRNNIIICEQLASEYIDNIFQFDKEYKYQVYAHFDSLEKKLVSNTETILINPYKIILDLLSDEELIEDNLDQPSNLKQAGLLLDANYELIKEYIDIEYSNNAQEYQAHKKNIEGLKRFYEILSDISIPNTIALSIEKKEIIFDKLIEAVDIAKNKVLNEIIILYYIIKIGSNQANLEYQEIVDFIGNKDFANAKIILLRLGSKLDKLIRVENKFMLRRIRKLKNNKETELMKKRNKKNKLLLKHISLMKEYFIAITAGDDNFDKNRYKVAKKKYNKAFKNDIDLPKEIKKVLEDYVNIKIANCKVDKKLQTTNLPEDDLDYEDMTKNQNQEQAAQIKKSDDRSFYLNTFDSSYENNASGATHSTSNTTANINLLPYVEEVYIKLLNKIKNIKESKDINDTSWCNDIKGKIQWTRAVGSPFHDLVNLFDVFMLYLENNKLENKKYSNYYSELLLSMIDLRKNLNQLHERIKYLCHGYKKIKQPDYFDQIIDIFKNTSKDIVYKLDNKVKTTIQNYNLNDEWKNEFKNVHFDDYHDFVNIKDIKLLYIQPGNFQMGLGNNKTLEIKITKGFYISETEITVKQYNEIMFDKKSETSSQPINNVSFDNAKNFISKLNESIKSKKYRLPTEAELEYAIEFLNSKLLTNKLKSETLEWCSDFYKKNYFKEQYEKLMTLKENNPEFNIPEYIVDPTGPVSGEERVLKRINPLNQFERKPGTKCECKLMGFSCKNNCASKVTGFRIVRSQ